MIDVSPVQKNTIGFAINVQVLTNFKPMDLSEASVKTLLLKKPSGAVIQRSLSFLNNGSDGKLIYYTVSGDLDQDGDWQLQAQVSNPDGIWWTDTTTFTVLPNLA